MGYGGTSAVDKALSYEQILQQVLRDEEQYQPLHGPKIVSACDAATGQYLLLAVGKQGQRHIDNIVFHAQLLNGKITVETDMTEEGLTLLLLEAGIPAEAFLSVRKVEVVEAMRIAA